MPISWCNDLFNVGLSVLFCPSDAYAKERRTPTLICYNVHIFCLGLCCLLELGEFPSLVQKKPPVGTEILHPQEANTLHRQSYRGRFILHRCFSRTDEQQYVKCSMVE